MDEWRERIQTCGDAALANALVESIEDVFAHDAHILNVGIHEVTIAAQLLGRLKPRIPNAPDGHPWDAHIEYNRQQAKVKTIHGVKKVRPDLILHRVNTDLNFLAIELKKGSSPDVDKEDAVNLEVYRWPVAAGGLNYQHSLFLRFGVGEDAGKVTCVAWF